MKFPRSGKARAAEPAPENAASEQQRLCPQCHAMISSRAKTCLYCGADLVAIAKAEAQQVKAIEQEKRAEAAQRPTRIFVILFTALAVFVFVAIIIQTSRSASIAALTPTITRTPTRPVLPTATPRATATQTGTPTPVPPLEYAVKNGDTPGRIALLYDVSLQELMAFNGKAEDGLIVVGEVLKIPPPTPKPGDTPTSVPGTPTPSPANEIVYIVQPGDTLSDIAVKYKTSLDAIQRRNSIADISKLMPGQQLIISTDATLTPEAASSSAAAVSSSNGLPTPIVQYAPVRLLTPLDREIFVGDSSPILLQWLSSGVLQPNELYLVEVERAGDIKPISFRTRATSYHLLTDQFPPPGDSDRTFKWRVMIIRQAGTGNDSAPTYRVVSPVSESSFEWLDTAPTPTPTATLRPGSRPAVAPSATPTTTP
jgi:LysM repeat protein